jgi:hypothetical protein
VAALYANSVYDAKLCVLGLSGQCMHVVPSQLTCGCPTHVNDRTELDMLKAEWDALGCVPPDVCPAIACPAPGSTGVCFIQGQYDRCIERAPTTGS